MNIAYNRALVLEDFINKEIARIWGGSASKEEAIAALEDLLETVKECNFPVKEAVIRDYLSSLQK